MAQHVERRESYVDIKKEIGALTSAMQTGLKNMHDIVVEQGNKLDTHDKADKKSFLKHAALLRKQGKTLGHFVKVEAEIKQGVKNIKWAVLAGIILSKLFGAGLDQAWEAIKALAG